MGVRYDLLVFIVLARLFWLGELGMVRCETGIEGGPIGNKIGVRM